MDSKTVAMQAFWSMVFPLVLSVASSVAAWALAKWALYLGAKAKESKWALATAQLLGIVQHVVAEAEVTLRPQFARAMADGTLTADEGKALKAEVMRIVRERVAPETLAFIRGQLGAAFETVLGGAVERAVIADGVSVRKEEPSPT
jgi:hypothetical protein